MIYSCFYGVKITRVSVWQAVAIYTQAVGECLRIVIPVVESRGGTVLRAFASYQCGSGLNPGLGVIRGLRLLLVFVLAPLFISGLCGFTPSTKTNTPSLITS